MKKFLLLLPLLAIGGAAVAQKSIIVKYEPSEIGEYAANEIEVQNPIRNPRLGAGDVIFSERFDSTLWHTANNNGVAVPSNMPNGWTAVDNTGNNFYWRWSTTGPRGYYTSGAGANAFIPRNLQKVNSTSDNWGDKGFMLFEADFYNTTAEGQAVQPFVTMDSYIQTRVFETTENPSINLYFEQWHRFCCANYGIGVGPKVYVSNNGVDWIEYPVHKGPIDGTPPRNPSVVEINISPEAATQSTVYLRFHFKGMSHYHWSIDDVTVYEPVPYDLRLLNFWADYAHIPLENPLLSPEKNISTTPYAIPYFAMQNILGYKSEVRNFGGLTCHDVVLETKLNGKNYEILDESMSNAVQALEINETCSLEVSVDYTFSLNQGNVGKYYYTCLVRAEEDDELPSNNTGWYDFFITRNVQTFSDPGFVWRGRAGIGNINGSCDGDGVGAIHMLNPVSNESGELNLHGARVFIANDINNWNLWRSGNLAYITAEIYAGSLLNNNYDFNLSAPIAVSEAMPVDSTFSGRWTFLSFGENSVPISPQHLGHQYMLVFRIHTNNQLFFLGANPFGNSGRYAHVLAIGNELVFDTPDSKVAAELIVGTTETIPLATLTFQFQNQYGNSLYGQVGITVPDENGIPVFIEIYTNNQGQAIVSGLKPGFYKYELGQFEDYFRSGMVLIDGQDTTVYFTYYSINELTALNEAQIYPNPTTSTFRISCPTPVSKIVLSTIEGKTVYSTDYPTENQEFSMDDFATGIYFVTIFDQKGNNITRKVVKL
jgi:hypothetical protein